MPNLKTTATVTLAGLIGAAGTVIAAPLVDGTRSSGDNYGSVPVATQGVSVIDIVNGEPVDIAVTSDQSNDGGVGAFGAGTFDFPAPDSDPASVTTGFEVAIDLDELGWDGSSPIRIAGWVANGGHNTMSNQVIGGLPAATGNFDDVTVVDFNTVPGNQYVTVPSSGSAAPAVDGTLDASYGSALFVNSLASTFTSNTDATDVASNGSEIDALYAYHDGDRLYLFVSGNLRTSFEKLNLFFDVQNGVGQNQLVENSSGVDFNALGNMAGMTFDSSFSANYYMNYTGDPTQHYLNMQLMPPGGDGLFAYFGDGGTKAPGNIQVLSNANPGSGSAPPNGGNVEATSDQSNIGGVATAVVDPDPYVSDPAAVLTGVEFKIGLPGLGYAVGSGDPIRVGGFVNGSNFDFLSNQVIGGVATTQGNLGGPVGSIDFNNVPGDQFVSFNIPSTLSAATINMDGTVDAGAYTLVYANDAGTTGTPTQFGDSDLADADLANGSEIDGLWLAVGLDTANDNKPTLFGVVTGNLETNFNKLNLFFDIDASTGQNQLRNDNPAIEFNNINNNMAGLTFDAGFSPDFMLNYTGGNDPVEHFVSGMFLLTDGQGTGGSGFGGGKEFVNPVTTDLTSRSGFGNNTDSSSANANGSELDNLYMRRDIDDFTGADTIYLMIGGNLEPNFNKLEVFIDTDTGNGQNTLIFSDLAPDDPAYDGNPPVDNSALNRMGGPVVITDDKGAIIEIQPGLTFDTGFNAEYYYTFTAGNYDGGTNTVELYGSYARLRGVQGSSDEGAGRYLGMAMNGGLGFFAGGDNPGETALIDINNANLGGVAGAEDQFGGTDSNPATVTTGIEIGIPVSDLPTWDGSSPLKIQVFINGQNHDFVSNQHLQFACTGDLGEPRFVDFNDFDGEQFAEVSYNAGTGRFSRVNDAPPVCESVEPCPGDANGDQAVDLADLNLVLANFGTATSNGDVTGDGNVDLADLNLVLANFGTSCN
ncbi:MAG: hypothetical protein ACF8MJ_01170 [Phycisphaerales bacterium JB050]